MTLTGIILYQSAVNQIEDSKREISSIHVEALTKSAWLLDYKMVEAILNTVRSLPYVDYVKADFDKESFSQGEEPEHIFDSYSYDIIQADYGQIGVLSVDFSRETIKTKIYRELLRILIFQIPLTILAVLGLLILIRRRIILPLQLFTDFTSTLSLTNLDQELLYLDNKNHKRDELDILNESLLRMRKTIKDQYLRGEKAEQSLSLATENYKELFHLSADGMAIIIKEDLKVLQSNQRLAEIMKCSDFNQLSGKEIAELFPSEIFSSSSNIWKASEEKFSSPQTVKLEKKPGSFFWAEVLVRPLTYQDTSCFLLSIRDITERKRTEEQLMHYQKMNAIGQLVSGIAHDFNNMLTGIFHALDMMKHSDDSEIQDQCWNSIEQSAKRAADMTTRLLNFGRKDSKRHELLDINHLIMGSKEFLGRSIDKRVDIILELKSTAPWVVGEESDIQNGMINLGINAFHAIEDHGSITFQTEDIVLKETLFLPTMELSSGTYLRVNLIDTGHGIPPEILDRIFEPFFTTKAAGKGTGLGLASVFAMVRRHHGAIDVKSRIGKGTTFSLYFPKAEKP